MKDLSNFSKVDFDAIIIGSGFGGSMIAHKLVNSGKKVLMIERGDWVVRGPHNWAENASVDLTPFYTMESPYRVLAGGNKKFMGSYSCVGGPSVFYGGVSFRFREQDFENPPEIVGDSGAEWPLTYRDFEPFYSEAEKLLNVAGDHGTDPTEPFRNGPYPQSPTGLSIISQRVDKAGRKLGFQPFALPLAINYSDNNNRSKCIKCTTCDTFACAVNAKNDLATVILPTLLRKGLTLLPNMITTKLSVNNNQVSAVECFSKKDSQLYSFQAKKVILSAGALGSPHLLLASGLNENNPGGKNIGHHLMRHVNAIVFGIFPGKPDKENIFHKQVGFLDFYFGHPTISNPTGKLGSIQQLQTPPVGLVREELPLLLGSIISPAVKLLTGLLTIAEDQPQFANHVSADWGKKDQFGLPQLNVVHYYSTRDKEAIQALMKKAKMILKEVGALFFYVHKIRTFSHAVGTVRMGKNPQTSVLDENCSFRGIDNLYVVDGSFMPTASGVNPSLTIAANALKAGEFMVNNW